MGVHFENFQNNFCASIMASIKVRSVDFATALGH